MPVKTKKAKTPVKELTGVRDLYHFLYKACDILRKFVEHESFKDYPADLMGDAYEILLKSFADESKAKAGEFYTPWSVVKLLVRILDPQPGERVYDPACGSGGMLIEAVHHMQNSKLCLGQIFGQGKNVKNAAIAKFRGTCNRQINFIVPRKDKVETLCLAYPMLSLQPQLMRTAASTTIPIMNKREFSKLTIPLPSLSLQREFVAIADKAESAKANLKKSIAGIGQVMKELING